MDFQTKIQHKDISIIGVNNHLCLSPDIDVDVTCVADVIWSAELDIRKWGIKDISVVVKGVSIQVEYEYFDEDDSLIRDCFYLNEKTLILQDELRVEGSCIVPESIEIDLTKQKIIVR